MNTIRLNRKFIFGFTENKIVDLIISFTFLSLFSLSASAASPEFGEAFPIIDQFGERVSRASFNRDATQILYYADQNADGIDELYIAPITAVGPNTPITDAAAVRLTNNQAGGNLSGTTISSDQARVVFIKINRDQAVPRYELFSAPVAGGSATKLNPDLAPGREITHFKISPDGTQVVYRADQNTAGVFGLFSVPITGGSAVQLNSLPSFADVGSQIVISPDSTRVVYPADANTDGIFELFSVPITGATPAVRLNSNLASTGNNATGISTFFISPDSARVIYRAEQNTDDVFELFSVPITGGIPERLNGDLSLGTEIAAAYSVSPDSTQVLYLAAQNSTAEELFAVSITGGTALRLNAELPAWSSGVFRYRVSPDGTQVVYSLRQGLHNERELYSVPISGGSAVRLKSQIQSGGNLGQQYRFSPNGTHVVYEADQVIGTSASSSINELYSVPVTGGSPVKLSETQTSGFGVADSRFGFTHDGTHVLYIADPFEDYLDELFIVPVTGGIAQRLNADLSYFDENNTNNGVDSDVDFFRVSPDDKFVMFDVEHYRRIPLVSETHVFLTRINETTVDDQLCFPVKTAIICF